MSEKRKDFLRAIVERDLAEGKYKEVVTRFPPEPNGFPHIGHAKSIVLNFGIARDYNGRCHLRMDDTNPETEEMRYVEAIKDAVKWLGFDWGEHFYFTSDYFGRLYDYAVELIRMGKAYVDSLNEEEIREYRGTVTEPGRRSVYAERSVEENLELFERMRKGEFPEGAHVLRARIDMASPNMKMRDPLLYRIRHTPHYRTGETWHIYPMYDFAHCLSDYIEGITHSFCTLEFENNREVYDWILDTLQVKPPRPHQYEFARLNMNYTVMSKRKLRELVEKGAVEGWDDPRMPTIAGYRRRGYTPESIVNFCEMIGVAKANSVVDVSLLEFAIRDDLNPKVPRVMCVLNPLKVVIENYEGSEEIDASYYPHDVPKEGSRKLPFSREIYIDRSDFEENPPKGYYRLTPDQPVRLKHAYIIRCKEVIKDEEGEIIEIRAEYYPDSRSGSDTSGIKVKSAIQWVEAKRADRVEVRLYDRLFRVENPQGPEDLNPDSLKIIPEALIEPSVLAEKPDERFQFEREGYFYLDPVASEEGHPVFNRIVPLKDSWAKKSQKKPAAKEQKPAKKEQSKVPQKEGEVTPMNAEQQVRFERYTGELGLGTTVAEILARDEALSVFFERAMEETEALSTLANLVANEVSKAIKEQGVETLRFTPQQIAQLAGMIEAEEISSKIAKEVFEAMEREGVDPLAYVEERGLRQISDPNQIAPIVDEVIAANPENVEKYRAGNERLFGFFVGQVLKATGGKANPRVVNELLKRKLSGE
ncbi:glutamine--tRNA ligase/YqeY domain fusion protein [Nitratifractor salsuginis]|uniref:Glutamine--tRNA ligase n=1 Tax=Nitratifractor salsuginis (strain DSM 16511 / JCM 12458 / E9I37-1) TaxID=749222 RepID=E6X3B4_NITSE|nr:glutamine--tRNA ligase/YqeY domain fusion protein [Nitratifractor salsuginis]ADV47327.1 glutaminyl-tRNA synthetase [Nitratifractor salsuginis DSM 16511]